MKLIEILSKRDKEVSRVFTTNDGFAVITINEHHADNIFKQETKQDLASNEFSPVMPPQLRAKKSVINPRVDDVIYEKNIADIGEEIAKKNEWICEEEIENVYKFSDSPTINLTFTQTNVAKKCTESGLKAFNISIPAHEIKLESYIPVKCCMRCYALEDHYTNECKKSKDYKICSECSLENHLWHQCRGTIKRCLNCEENHSALAMKCIKRKEILKVKRAQENEKQKMSYSSISQATLPPKMPTYKLPEITREDRLRINICVAHAQCKDKENPGSYANELNKALKANSLPSIIIPEDPNTQTQKLSKQADTGATCVEPQLQTQHNTSSRQSSKSEFNANYESLPDRKLDSSEYGLEFFTTKDKGWPTTFSTDELIKGIQSKMYKWKYTNKKYTEDQVLRKTKKGGINLSNCFFAVEEDEFRNIRSGLNQERSPMELRDPRLEKRRYTST